MMHAVRELDQRATNIVLVTLFLAVISLPLAANLAGFDGADAGAENRELATFPTIGRSWSAIARLPDGVSLWFEDHFGFRAALVRWYGESRLFLLGVSPSAAVVKGRNGWFFYGDDKSIEDYANDEPLSAEGMANWRAAVTRASDWLKGRGIAYVFTIAPDKHVVYPEEMPSSLARIRARSRTDQVYEDLHGSGVASVDVRPALLEAKTHERIYQRTDTHWNDHGALAAYRQIIAAVRTQVPSTPAPWSCADFEPAVRQTEGMDLAGMMGLTRVLREQDLVLVPMNPFALTVRPVVCTPTRSVTVELPNHAATLQIDGSATTRMRKDDVLSIAAFEKRLQIVRFSPPERFYHLLRQKLGWGLPLVPYPEEKR